MKEWETLGHAKTLVRFMQGRFMGILSGNPDRQTSGLPPCLLAAIDSVLLDHRDKGGCELFTGANTNRLNCYFDNRNL